MILVILTAFAAMCGAAKLDTSYLPPISARTAGGSTGTLLVSLGKLLSHLNGSSQGPAGSYTDEVQGVVVDAVNPGTRTSGKEPTGLGGPRTSYGSTNSKVGGAAFRSLVAGLANPGSLTRIAPGFGSFVESDEAQGDKASGNSLKFTSNVGLENYSYGFETDNGTSVGEQGEAADGVKAQGGYSYKGDVGKTNSVSYTADKGGYKPQGLHLPSPPPIPNEISISLNKSAKEAQGSYKPLQPVSKPQTTQRSSFTYTQSETQYGQKPVSTNQTGVTSQQTQFVSSGSKFGQNSQPIVGSGLVSTTVKPIGSSYQQTQFASTGSKFGQSSQPTSGSGLVSTTTKPIGSSYQQTQFGSTGSQFGQTSQSTFGAGSVSRTIKPFGSSYQQTQFGSTGSKFGQNFQSAFGAGAVSTTAKPFFGSYKPVLPVSKPQTSQGSSFTYTQSQTQYGQKPVTTTQTGATSQQTQFGLTGSQYGLNSQSNFGSGSVFTTAKPFGSSYQQTQLVSSGSKFGQNSQSTFGSGFVSTTAKPFGSSYQQTQFGSTDSRIGQNSHSTFGSGAVSTTVTPIGTLYQQTQFVSSGSKFGQNSQPTFCSSLVPTTSKPLFGQTSFGSTTQNKLGTISQAQPVQTVNTQASTQFQKPLGSQSTQTTNKQTQFTQGQKPFGSSQGSIFQFGQSAVDQPTQSTVQTSSVTGDTNSLFPLTGLFYIEVLEVSF